MAARRKKRGTTKKRASKKRLSKPKRRVKLSMGAWQPINFHPKTGANLKGLGYHLNYKTGALHRFTFGQD